MRAGVLAVRAANEYRRRDLVSYSSLRYLFGNEAARGDRWATEVVADLVLTRSDTPYRHSRVYRGVGDRGLIEYRDLYFPGPTEMLAEAGLLRECARVGGWFARAACVYSNVLAEPDSREGMVVPYYVWWRRRQQAIAKMARSLPGGVVCYFDIRRFYSSVADELATSAWRAGSQPLAPTWVRLGEKLLEDYRVAARPGALLMGPMFAHMMGNLVLRGFDEKMLSLFGTSYFRYVDDIAIVLPAHRPDLSRVIQDALPPGLLLNEEKTLEMDAPEWAQQEASFPSSSGTQHWIRLVSALKYSLVAHFERFALIRDALRDEGFRLPLRDYSRAARERGYLDRLASRLKQKWFDRRLAPSSLAELLRLAHEARAELRRCFERAAASERETSGMARKFHVRCLRYTSSRLLYLASIEDLQPIESAIANVRELSDVRAIYGALRSLDVSSLLPFSGVVAQAAAQLLGEMHVPVSCNRDAWQPELEFAWAVLRMNGVEFQPSASAPSADSPLVKLAIGDKVGAEAANRYTPYYQEVFGLRRQTSQRPVEFLQEALDSDEVTVFDAIDLLRASS